MRANSRKKTCEELKRIKDNDRTLHVDDIMDLYAEGDDN